MRADLHLHSTCSDGSLPVPEVIALARDRDLAVIGITDHDTVSHFALVNEHGPGSGLTVVPGVEFSTRLAEYELHLIGYCVNELDPELVTHLEKVRRKRLERAREILERLAARNVCIPPEELDRIPANRTIGRVLIAHLIYNYGYVRSPDEAFNIYIGRNGSAYVPYAPADAREVVELIARTGGVSVFAHPSQEELAAAADTLCEAGLQGIEAWRPRVYRATLRAIKAKADEKKLILTGGSDWHYEGGYYSLGDFHIDTRLLGEFFELAGIFPKSPHHQLD